MGTESLSLDNRATLIALAFFESFGFSISYYNFLFAAVTIQFLPDVKWIGPCILPRFIACFLFF
jgi:hypothetical protein